jgi:hypothetical protein
MSTLHNNRKNPKHDVFITPKEIIQKIKYVFDGDIDLDPCTMMHNPTGANHFFSDFKNEDGILESWKDYKNVFVNPPFSDIKTWVNKIIVEERPTILLTKCDPRTVWFQKILQNSSLSVVLSGNLKFENQFDSLTDSSAPFAVMISYLYAPSLSRFIESFSEENYTITYNYR